MSNDKKNQPAKTGKKVQEEVTQELPKNPMEYTYRGNEIIEIPASLFLQLYRANDAAMTQGTKQFFPPALEWVSVATGMPVKDPKEIDIKEGRVVQTLSVERTFVQENIAETYEPWLYPDVIKAKDAMIQIHTKNVNEGNAVKISDLQKERQEQQKKARAAAQAAAEAAAKDAESPQEEGPKEEKKG